MAQTSCTFRSFVSSAFGDLVAERNALRERVFPRLRDRIVCQLSPSQRARSLIWLPNELPEHVSVIASTSTG